MYLFTVLEAELSKIKVLESSKSVLSVLGDRGAIRLYRCKKTQGEEERERNCGWYVK